MWLKIFILTITLLNFFTPVLAAPGDIWLVYRADSNGQYPTKTGEKWIDNPPEVGKNIPTSSIVMKFIPEGADTNPWNYKRTSTNLVYDPPKQEAPVEQPPTVE